MNSNLWIRRALTMSLTVAIFATYSMVALAADGRTAGEIVITGNTNSTAVTVNGESAKSGRTIFSSSTISTPDDAGAIVNLGKAGRIEVAPGSTFVVTFDDRSVSGDLTAGSVSVLNASDVVGIKTLAGDLKLNAGETANANAASGSATPAPATHHNLWPFYLVLGAAAVVILWTAAKDNNTNLGGGANTISPPR